MGDAEAPNAGLASFFCDWSIDGPAGPGLHFLFPGRTLGLLPSGQTALWLHGALQEKEQRPGAGRQRAGSLVVDVRFQLSVRGVHCQRSERDGPRAAVTSQWREHVSDVIARGNDCGRRVQADSAGAARLVARVFESAEVSPSRRGDPDALDRSADADAE